MATSGQLAGPASDDADQTLYISERGQETQLRHEFRLKRHEKLTGPAF